MFAIPSYQKDYNERNHRSVSSDGVVTITQGAESPHFRLEGRFHGTFAAAIRRLAVKSTVAEKSAGVAMVFRSVVTTDGQTLQGVLTRFEEAGSTASVAYVAVLVATFFDQPHYGLWTGEIDPAPVAKKLFNELLAKVPELGAYVVKAPIVVPTVAVVAPQTVTPTPVVVAAPTIPLPAVVPEQGPVVVKKVIKLPTGFLEERTYASPKERADRHAKAVKFFKNPNNMAQAMRVIGEFDENDGISPEKLALLTDVEFLAQIYLKMPSSYEVALAPYGALIQALADALAEGVSEEAAVGIELLAKHANWEMFLRAKNNPNATKETLVVELAKAELTAVASADVSDIATTITHLTGGI